MNDSHFHEHLGAETVQAFLDGALSPAERAHAEEHLAACARCAAELDGWRTLFEGIQDLPVLAPRAGFADRVVAGIESPVALPWAARARAALGARLGIAAESGHATDERLQDLAAGALAARLETRLREHMDGCASCASRAESWRTMLGYLDGLERFAPSVDFAARVMAEVRIPVPVLAPAAAAATATPARVPEWRRLTTRLVARVRALVPRSRRAWAAISGVAVTPVVTLGLVVWTVFTHPAITVAGLASFAWWKAQELVTLAWGAATSRALESTQLFGLLSWLRSLALSPVALVALFLVFSAGMVAATWVLYRNLVKTHPVDAGYGHPSLS